MYKNHELLTIITKNKKVIAHNITWKIIQINHFT